MLCRTSVIRPFCVRSGVATLPRRFNHGVVQRLIEGSIKSSGPIPVSTYMQMCLYHPTEGYYMKKRSEGTDLFGSRGDFTTSPEISQVFGELVCLWFMSIWRDAQPALKVPKIRVVELGPGRGTLMHDFIRTLQMFPDAGAALTSVHLVETSPVMRASQAKKLATFGDKVYWYESIEDVSQAQEDEFTMIVAHEFFDALPINIFKKIQSGYKEVFVDIAQEEPGNANHLPFNFVVSQEPSPRSAILSKLSSRFDQLPDGSRIEISVAAWKIGQKIGELLSNSSENGKDDKNSSIKGAALIIDYGDDCVSSSSFRAFKNHSHIDVFEDPGNSDLTANVDFALIKEALKGLGNTYGPMTQREFLLRMGIMERIAMLAHNAKDGSRREAMQSAGLRIVDQVGQGMGKMYKVLGVTSRMGEEKPEIWPFVRINN